VKPQHLPLLRAVLGGLAPALLVLVLPVVLHEQLGGRAAVPATLAVNGLLYLAGLLAATAAHEAGHALAGLALGLRLFRVTLGYGPPVLRRQAGRVVLELAVVPLGGSTLLAPRPGRVAAARLRLWLVVAAGPALSAATAALGAWLAGSAPRPAVR